MAFKAVILAGGRGKRLKPITDDVPKPLIKVADKPIVVHQIEWLKRYEVEEFIITIGYLKEKFMDVLGSGRKYGVHISYLVEDEPLGTGGGLRNAGHLLDKESCFYVINGDVITDIDPSMLMRQLGNNVVGVVALVPLTSPYGVVKIDENFMVVDFEEKPMLKDYWINAGVYLFKNEIFEHLPYKGDLERTIFPKLAQEKKLKGVKYAQPRLWRSIDTWKDLEEVENTLKGSEIRVSERELF